MRPRRPLVANIATAIRRLGRDAVTLHWIEVSGGEIDPVSKAVLGGSRTHRTKVIDALVHWPQVGGSTAVRNFAGFDDGDVIVDVTAETMAADIAGKPDLRFEIQGVYYRQKNETAALAASWDAMKGSIPFARPILLEVVR